MSLTEILSELNFQERATKLHAFGKEHGAGALEEFGQVGDDTFKALAAIEVARGAGVVGYSSQFLDHPSGAVQKTAISSGLLPPDELKTLFLSPTTSRNLRIHILQSGRLPCDAQTLELAHTFRNQYHTYWADLRLLSQCKDSEVFRAAVVTSCCGRLQPRFALRFPAEVLELQKREKPFVCEARWLVNCALHDFDGVLSLITGPSACSEKVATEVIQWAWRKRPEAMSTFTLGPETRFTRVQLLALLIGVKRDRTFNGKLKTIVDVFKRTASAEDACYYVELFPPCGERKSHCKDIICAFWEVVETAGVRNVWPIFQRLAKVLPNVVLAQELLDSHDRHLQQPDAPTFAFVHSLGDLNDEMRLAIFKKFLGRGDICTSTLAMEIFGELRQSCTDPRILQEAFDKLVEAFDGQTLSKEVAQVIEKMRTLELGLGLAGIDGLPRCWVHLCVSLTSNDPLGLFLQTTLLNLEEGPLLESLVKLFGRCIFWDLASAVLGKRSRHLASSLQRVATSVASLKDLENLQHREVRLQCQTGNANDIYFATADELKKTTTGRDAAARTQGYTGLLALARKAIDTTTRTRIYDDLVPFLIKRTHNEAPAVKFPVVRELLKLFPPDQWQHEHISALWLSAQAARTEEKWWRPDFTEFSLGLVRHAVRNWGDRQEVMLHFASEVFEDHHIYVDLFCEVATLRPVPDEGCLEWLFDHAVPDTPQTSLELFVSVFDAIVSGTGHGKSEVNRSREIWNRYAFIPRRWCSLLGFPVEPHMMRFLLVGVVEWVSGLQTAEVWFQPLHDAYRKASSGGLERLASLDVRPTWGMQVVKDRVVALLSLKQKVGMAQDEQCIREAIDVATCIVQRVPETQLRKVLWEADSISGASQADEAAKLCSAALQRLDANQEGTARVLTDPQIRQQLFLASGCNSDLLANLMQRYLLQAPSASSLDRRVLELASRPDAPALLFFGKHFGRHLTKVRQEVLHRLLNQLSPLSSSVRAWYHYTVDPQASCGSNDLSYLAGGSPTTLWHPHTQELFVSVGLQSTERQVLNVLPGLEYVDTSTAIIKLVTDFPRAQSKVSPCQAASSDWELVDQHGDIWDEVQRRFKALAWPILRDEMCAWDVDVLLGAVGRADHTDRALRVLSHFSSSIKKAKSALIAAIKGLSGGHARRIIGQVAGSEGTGTSTRIAVLRLIRELQVHDPWELLETAWRGGACHRDVAAVVLSQVGLLDNLGESNVAAACGMFDTFQPNRFEHFEYICKIVLQDLYGRKWVLPSLCNTVVSWAHNKYTLVLPAVKALVASQGVPVTVLVRTCTTLLLDARQLGNVDIHGQAALALEWKQVARHITNTFVFSRPRDLEHCDFEVLLSLVEEIFRSIQADRNAALSSDACVLWSCLLRAETDSEMVDWIHERVQTQCDKEAAYASMAHAATQRALDLGAGHRAVGSSCWVPALQAVDLSLKYMSVNSKSRIKLLTDCRASLLTGGNFCEDELWRLLRDPDAKTSADRLVQLFLHGPHRWLVLEWFASTVSNEPPYNARQRLSNYCAQAILDDRSASLEDALRILDRHRSQENIDFVVKLEAAPVETFRAALAWLALDFPGAAVELYPRLLRLEPSEEDVEVLLRLCIEHREPLPVIPPAAVSNCLDKLRRSELVSARLQVVRLFGTPPGRIVDLEAMAMEDESSTVCQVCKMALTTLNNREGHQV